MVLLRPAARRAGPCRLTGLTLRDIATRVGMRQPSLYSHFASKNAIYDGMFEQAWRTFLDYARDALGDLPTGPRARLIAIAERYFDFAVATWRGTS